MTAEPGRRHRKGGRPGPETTDLLGRAHAALRDELADCLTELRPAPVVTAELVLGDPVPPGRPSLADRDRLVGLIGRLMTLLGTEIVVADEDAVPAPARRRRSRIDYGGA